MKDDDPPQLAWLILSFSSSEDTDGVGDNDTPSVLRRLLKLENLFFHFRLDGEGIGLSNELATAVVVSSCP